MYGKNLKLALMGALLLISNVTFSQVTERERPKEWDQLVNGARFMDRFLPMKGNKLSSDTWGTAGVRPRYVDNGIEDRIWSYWGGNIRKGHGRIRYVHDHQHGKIAVQNGLGNFQHVHVQFV